jgi:integrase
MRCCGARIGEALGAHKADFTEREDGSKVWQLRWQAADDGKSLVALKHRPAGEGRDIPVPEFIWRMIAALPDGPLCPGATRRTRYLSYVTATDRLAAIAAELGIDPAWHAHNLRHQFATEEAASGANIADLSETLGHQSPDITYRRYVRSMPGRLDRMAARMNARWTAGPAPLTPAQAA